MKSSSVLDHVVLGYSPVFDQRRALVAIRLSVFPTSGANHPGNTPADGVALWALLGQAVDKAPQRVQGLPALWVSVASESLLEGLLQAAQAEPRRVLIEVPAFFAAPRQALVQRLHAQAQPLALMDWSPDGGSAGGSTAGSSFEWLCQPAQQAPVHTLPAGLAKQMLRVGARCDADFDAGFKQGAHAVTGWPMDEDFQIAAPATIPPELRGVLDLMNRVEREEPVARLEAVLTADPSLAYRLLRYLNTSAFGLRAEVSSFRHGLMMLGYQRLKRWLALLLVSGSQDPKSRMLMAVAARRGLILDQLANGLADEAMRGEMFICGVFSLLDRMLHLPMGELVRHVPMHERVQLSLNGHGPYSPHLALMGALEGGSAMDIRECAEAALVGRAELNRAVLKGLALSWELE